MYLCLLEICCRSSLAQKHRWRPFPHSAWPLSNHCVVWNINPVYSTSQTSFSSTRCVLSANDKNKIAWVLLSSSVSYTPVNCQISIPRASKPPAMPLVKTMCREFLMTMKCHWSPCLLSCWYQRPPVSKYVSEHPGGLPASDSTRYHHVWSTMVHWLLCCGALGTSLIIYPACVYLCWTRLCGGGGRERKADRILPACMWGARKSRGAAGFVWACVHVFVCVCVCLRDRSSSNTVMPTWVMVWLTETHTQNI